MPADRWAAVAAMRLPMLDLFSSPTILPTIVLGQFVVDRNRPNWFGGATNNAHKRNSRGNVKESAMNAQELLQEISDYCRQTGLAESTFGRRAVNDGKLAARLRNGGRITTDTLDRIHNFMSAHPPLGPRPIVIERPRDGRPNTMPALQPAAAPGDQTADPQRNFRFFDNR